MEKLSYKRPFWEQKLLDTKPNDPRSLIDELVVVFVLSSVAGFVIGYVQSGIAFYRWGSDFPSFIAFGSALLGAIAAALLFPILYYTLLRRQLTKWGFALGSLACLILGSIAAFLLNWLAFPGAGWLSIGITPMVAVFMSVGIRFNLFTPAKRN